jgi:selenophosphate synthetase-related protein
MNENNPLNPIIKQLNDLLVKCDEGLKKTDTPLESPNRVLRQVAALKMQINMFKEATDSALKDLEETDLLGKTEELLFKEKEKSLNELKKIEEALLKNKLQIAPQVEVAKKQEATQKKKEKVREKKFRGLNPRGKWQKL